MPSPRQFILATYTPLGVFVSESEHVSLFEAEVTAQRESVEGGGRVSLVKDRRHSHTRLLRVWVSGRPLFRTPHKRKGRP